MTRTSCKLLLGVLAVGLASSVASSNLRAAEAPPPSPDDLKGLPLIRVDDGLIDQLNAAIKRYIPTNDASYFVAVLPDGSSVVIDRPEAKWTHIENLDTLRSFGSGNLQYVNEGVDLGLDDQVLACRNKWNNVKCCRGKSILSK